MRTGNLFIVHTSYCMITDQAVLELIFPHGTFEWFTVAQATRDDQTVHITFEEKNIPPPKDSTTSRLRTFPFVGDGPSSPSGDDAGRSRENPACSSATSSSPSPAPS